MTMTASEMGKKSAQLRKDRMGDKYKKFMQDMRKKQLEKKKNPPQK